MKKTYSNPQMNVFEIEAPNLCAVSDKSANIYDSGSVSAGNALGRGNDGDDW